MPHLTLTYRKLLGGELECHHIALLGILLFMYAPCYLGQETVEMAVHRGVSIIVSDVECIAIAACCDSHLGDVAIGNGEERFARDALRLEVEPPMKVVRAQLAEVTAQKEWEVKRHTERHLLCHALQQTNKSQYTTIYITFYSHHPLFISFCSPASRPSPCATSLSRPASERSPQSSR